MSTFEQLLGGEELYHYHSKLMMKEVSPGQYQPQEGEENLVYVPDKKDDTYWCVVSGRDRRSARLAPGLRLLVRDGQTWKMG